jgi:hypothetical protein
VWQPRLAEPEARLGGSGLATSLADVEPRLVTIFLTISALVNIGLGYWLATYLAREKARAGVGAPIDATVDTDVDSHAQAMDAALPPESSPALPTMAQPMAAAPSLPAAPTAVAPAMAPVAVAAPPTTAPAEAPELETEVLAGIEEFRNQLAQMKATPDAAEPVTTSV